MTRLFWSDTYQDITSMALCKKHHTGLKTILDLEPWEKGDKGCDDDCEICEDANLLSIIVTRHVALNGGGCGSDCEHEDHSDCTCSSDVGYLCPTHGAVEPPISWS